MPRLLRRSLLGSLKPLLAAAAASALSGVSCGSDPTAATPTTAHVVLISLDGLRPDAITTTNAPALSLLVQQGAATLQAQTVLPSLTLPSHTSMVTGLVPDRHRITWNDDISTDTTLLTAPTVFDLAGRAGYSSAMFAGKSKLIGLAHTEAPRFVKVPPPGGTWKSDTVAAYVRKYLTLANGQPKPRLMFIHLPDIDIAGHASGWMSPEYHAAVRHTDSVFARISLDLKTAFGTELVLIVTADHGGFGYNHSEGSVLDRTVPWIVWGKDVSPQVLPAGIRAVDVAPTILWVFGITPPANLDGVPVKSAFPTLTH